MKEINICSWIITDKLNRILLIKRKYNVLDLPNHWAVPWWKQEKLEDLNFTVIREVKEEVWLDFIITKLYIESKLIINDLNLIKYFYRYLWIVTWKIKIQESECDWYGWFTYNEAKELLMSSNMVDIIEQLYKDNYIK